MLKDKIYIWLLIGLMFGMVVPIPGGSSATTIVIGHWTHDTDNNFLVPTNESVDVSLNNNSLLYADMSTAAGDNLSWDAADMQFDVTGAGFGVWNRAGTTLYTKVDGDAVQLNNTLYTKGNISMEGNRTINATGNLTVGNAGDVFFGDDVLRDMYPFVDLMMNLGTPSNRFNYVYGLSLFGDGGNITNINASNLTGTLLLNPFNQWLNNTDNATFTWLDIVNDANISGDVTAGKNANVTGGDLNVSDGNVYIHGTDNNAIYPYSLNVWNLPGRAWSYIFIGNAEGGPDGGAFFGLEGAPGGDRFALYNWQGGGIRFLTDLVATSGKTRLDILNNGNIHVYQNLSIGQASDSGGGLILKGRNLVGTTNDLGGHITWYHDTGIEGYTFVNTNSQYVWNNSVQNKVDDVGKAWVELDTGNANFDGNLKYGNIHYAEMYMHNDVSPNVTVILLEDVWYNTTAFNQADNGQTLNGFTYANSNLTCVVAGKYQAIHSITHGGTANNKYHFAVGVNGVPQFNTETHERMGTPNDITSCSSSGFIDLVAGDLVSVQVMNEDGANDVTVYSINLNLMRIGD